MLGPVDTSQKLHLKTKWKLASLCVATVAVTICTVGCGNTGATPPHSTLKQSTASNSASPSSTSTTNSTPNKAASSDGGKGGNGTLQQAQNQMDQLQNTVNALN